MLRYFTITEARKQLAELVCGYERQTTIKIDCSNIQLETDQHLFSFFVGDINLEGCFQFVFEQTHNSFLLRRVTKHDWLNDFEFPIEMKQEDVTKKFC